MQTIRNGLCDLLVDYGVKGTSRHSKESERALCAPFRTSGDIRMVLSVSLCNLLNSICKSPFRLGHGQSSLAHCESFKDPRSRGAYMLLLLHSSKVQLQRRMAHGQRWALCVLVFFGNGRSERSPAGPGTHAESKANHEL